ncbi:MAG: hypothetical protein K2L64_00705, partial [Ureaplasma sp.]|nr:hypothetical protein [Ureaplasma sp.]
MQYYQLPLLLLASSTIIYSSCSKILEENSQLLTKQKVKDNFKTIWKDKKFLGVNDLSNYSQIERDAFDNLDRVLEYVDISNLEIIDYLDSIKWLNVKEIRVNNSENVKIINNLLCIKSLFTWNVNTIANRSLKMDMLIFPTSNEMYGNSNSKYAIVNS